MSVTLESIAAKVSQSNDRYGLSDREIEMLRLLCEGQMAKQIAGKLGISVHTVDNHRVNIQQKLGAKNQVNMAYLAAKRGVL